MLDWGGSADLLIYFIILLNVMVVLGGSYDFLGFFVVLAARVRRSRGRKAGAREGGPPVAVRDSGRVGLSARECSRGPSRRRSIDSTSMCRARRPNANWEGECLASCRSQFFPQGGTNLADCCALRSVVRSRSFIVLGWVLGEAYAV